MIEWMTRPTPPPALANLAAQAEPKCSPDPAAAA